MNPTQAAIARLVAEALREAAHAIDAGVLPSHPNSGYKDGFARAASIVRERADRVEAGLAP